MSKVRRTVFSSIMIGLFGAITVFGDNPIFQTVFTADPAPMVYKDTLFCYTSHDADVLENNFFTMRDWYCFSTTDMVNWQSRGRIASLKNYTWTGTNGAWAVQCVQRNGKFYMYTPIHMKGIGVLVANSPTGPFTDPLGMPLLKEAGGEIDPTAFIDDDGQAYLYWGNPNCRYVKLNADMISYTGGINQLLLTEAGFGKRSKVESGYPSTYQEGPWFYKRNSIYYLAYAGGPLSEHLGYSTSTGPTGPWKYGSVIMPTFSGCAFTNHPGITDYKGNSYIFYHSQQLSNDGYKRSVCVEKFTYSTSGAIPTVTPSKDGAPQIGALNPYDTIQAETICYESGVETNPCSEGGIMVDTINNNDYIKVKGVDFADGAKSFDARVASGTSGGKIELRLDSQTGKLIGTCDVAGTGGWDKWTTKTCTITDASGKHDLYMKFTGGSGLLFNFNWWKFTGQPTNVNKKQAVATGTSPKVRVTNRTGTDATIEIQMHTRLTNSNLKVSLFDIAGRNIKQRSLEYTNGKTVSVQFYEISSGNYFVKVFSGEELLSSDRVVIQ